MSHIQQETLLRQYLDRGFARGFYFEYIRKNPNTHSNKKELAQRLRMENVTHTEQMEADAWDFLCIYQLTPFNHLVWGLKTANYIELRLGQKFRSDMWNDFPGGTIRTHPYLRFVLTWIKHHRKELNLIRLEEM